MGKQFAATISLEDIAAAHAAKQFAVISIDHQFMMQLGAEGNVHDFQNYNTDHAYALNILRTHNVPVIHAIYCVNDTYLKLKYNGSEIKEFKRHVHAFLHNDDMTLSATKPDDAHALQLDLLSDVKDGDIFIPKYGFSAFDNEAMTAHIKKMGYKTLGFMGSYNDDCVLASLKDAKNEFGVVAFAEAIEGRMPRPLRKKRIEQNRTLFHSTVPEALVTTANVLQTTFKKYSL